MYADLFQDTAPGYLYKESTAEIVCCSLDGTSCSRIANDGNCRSFDNQVEEVTWSKANQHCEDAGLRLCDSQQELDSCCGTGCNHDNKKVWSGLMEGN